MINNRFLSKEDISHYTPICYKLSEEERKHTIITCIGGYCKCIDKSKCDCYNNLKNNFKLSNVK